MWSTSATSTVAPPLLRPPMLSSSFLLLPAAKTLVIPPFPPAFHVSVRCSPSPSPADVAAAAPVKKGRGRRKILYPGEDKGIAEEMRFVAMRLRDAGAKRKAKDQDKVEDKDQDQDGDGDEDVKVEQENKVKDEQEQEDKDQGEATWQPSLEGFLKYLVDSRVVFDTIESIVDRSDDSVTYAHFRGTGLERTKCLFKDIEHFSNLGFRIPEPSSPGTKYANYLKEQAESSVPSFLSHFYNIYFAHFSGGRAIGEKISSKLLEGGQLEFYKCEGDQQAMLKDIRDKLNKIGEDWSRAEKCRCLRETAKCFKLSAGIVRLIIL